MDHNARSSRRNVLAFLGLAGAGASLPLQTEAMALHQDGTSERHVGSTPHLPKLGNCISCKATAHALRQLADGLESGRVIPEGIDLKSSLGTRGGFLSQELHFVFYLTDDGKESPINQKDGFEWIPDKEAAVALQTVAPRHLSAVWDDPAIPIGVVEAQVKFDSYGVIRDLENNGFAIVKLT